jgi:tRNA (adenine57-N1/adenine58-N1)-methyltransferase
MKLVIHSSGRVFLHEKGDLHTQYGVIKENDLKKKKVKSHKGETFVVVDATSTDYVRKMKKGAQIIYPKDLGLIAGFTGVCPGFKVVDCGSGSGSLSLFLGNLVRPTGRVITYERRPEFAIIAKENIKKFGLSKIVKLKEKDFLKGIPEKNQDLITLDLEESEKAIPIAKKALKPGGQLVLYSGRIEDLMKEYRVLKEEGFFNILTLESGLRQIEYTKCVRFKNLFGYVGYLTFARKFD